MFKRDSAPLIELGLPEGDLKEEPNSDFLFPDEAQFRTELSTVNTAEALKAALEQADKVGITINRIAETFGIFRHRNQELKDMLQLCREKGVEINFSIGPRATYDISPTAKSKHGAQIGYRLRGMNQVLRAVEDVKRAVDLGCRGITLYDEGLLWVLGELKKNKKYQKMFNLKFPLMPDRPIQRLLNFLKGWEQPLLIQYVT